MREADETLGERLRSAEHVSADIARQTEAGGEVLSASPAPAAPIARPPAAVPDRRSRQCPTPRRIVAAAQAFADAPVPRVRGARCMKQLLRDFRLVPIVLIAVGCLFALKVMGSDVRRRLHARRSA